MPAKISMHIPDQAVVVRVLADASDVELGRDSKLPVPLLHASVSRRHARLAETRPGVWQLTDLESKNGTRVDGARIQSAQLVSGRWFAIGDVYCEFEIIGSQEQDLLRTRAAERRNISQAWGARLRTNVDLQPLLADLLTGIVQVAECQRGFLLTPDSLGEMRVVACYALEPDELRASAFSGSRSAVERVRRKRQPVYLSDESDRAWLKDRVSVIAQGISALVCLPLLHDGELLGIAYADTSAEARVFTDLDAEVLGALVDHAASALAASRLAAQLARLSAWVAVDAKGATRSAPNPPAWTAPGAPA